MTALERAFHSWGSYDRDDPYPLFAEALRLSPVHKVTLQDGHDAWLVMRYDEARAALNDPRLSKDMQAALAISGEVVAEGLPGPDFARHMLVVDPPDHTRLRRLVSSAFSNRRVEELRPHIQAIVDALLDEIAERGPDERVDLVGSFAFPLPFRVICELLGIPVDDRQEFGAVLTTLLTTTSSDAEHDAAVVASDAVVAYLIALVEMKTSNPGPDLVSGLIEACEGDVRLTEQELLSTIFQLIVAGHDTTTSLIGNGLVALLRHPDQKRAVSEDPELISTAIEELLRYDAPVPHATFRFATEPIDLGGVTIPAGAQVIINLASANRDPAHYSDPESLRVDRAEARHLAFGHGIHFCLGAALARLEADLALTTLLGRFPQLRLAVAPSELHWNRGDGLVLRGLSALPVIPGAAGDGRRREALK